MDQIFFELIRIAIGTQFEMPRTLSDLEWKDVYDMSKKQSLVGVCFAAVQRLPEDMQPPEMLYLTWMGMAAKIQQRNEIVNRQCVELQAKLCADGIRSSILKGQGVASLYSEHLRGLRQSGDIDLWIAGDYQHTIAYLKKKDVAGTITANHAEAHFFVDTEVEVHPIPAIFRNPF